jgi:hypothetical protein
MSRAFFSVSLPSCQTSVQSELSWRPAWFKVKLDDEMVRFRRACVRFPCTMCAVLNLTLTKIPKSVLGKCQWGRDDYSFIIDVMAPADEPLGDDALEEENPSA